MQRMRADTQATQRAMTTARWPALLAARTHIGRAWQGVGGSVRLRAERQRFPLPAGKLPSV
jgi:hypothetical protein